MNRVFFTDRDLGKQFPAILREAGILVERHCDHFADDAPDEAWLSVVGARGWIALTHDRRIRYKMNERDAVMSNGVALFVVVGKARYADLARGVAATTPRIEAFLGRVTPPFIAKVYQPSRAGRSGKVELWLSARDWKQR